MLADSNRAAVDTRLHWLLLFMLLWRSSAQWAYSLADTVTLPMPKGFPFASVAISSSGSVVPSILCIPSPNWVSFDMEKPESTFNYSVRFRRMVPQHMVFKFCLVRARRQTHHRLLRSRVAHAHAHEAGQYTVRIQRAPATQGVKMSVGIGVWAGYIDGGHAFLFFWCQC